MSTSQMSPDEGVKINISIDDHPSIAQAVHSVEDVSTMLHDGIIKNLKGLSMYNAGNSEGDDHAIKVQTSPDGKYSGALTAEKDQKVYRPNVSRRSSFVQVSSAEMNDDPFRRTPPSYLHKSPANRKEHRGSERVMKRSPRDTPTKSRSERTMTNWRNGSSTNSDTSPMYGNSSRLFDVQSSAGKGQVSKENAQSIYPPSSCVFVANLNHLEGEAQLEMAVTKIFREFGTVWVKIRRDGKNMPFAFCQYTSDADAQRAITEGKGRLIHGRPCRTEKAKANRTYIISRRNGDDIAVGEARKLLSSFGVIERAWLPTETEISMFGLARGAFITFAFYEAGRDAIIKYRDDDEYCMQVVEMPLASPLRVSKSQGTADSYAAQLYLNTYDVDRRSIFVGNLPHHITERGVQELLSSCGSILSVVVNKRRSIREGCDLNVYAFVEFSDYSAVQNAIATKHGHFMGGLRLKVTQKHSDYHREDRPARRSTEYEHQTPNYRSPAQVSDTTMTPLTPYYASPYGGYPAPFTHGSWSSGGYPAYPGQQYSYGYGVTPYWSGSPGYATRNTGSENGNATSAPAPYYPVYSPYTPEYYASHYQIPPPGCNTSGYTGAATVNAANGSATSPSPAGDTDAFIMQESTPDNQ